MRIVREKNLSEVAEYINEPYIHFNGLPGEQDASSSTNLLDTHSNLKVFGISGPCYFRSKKIFWDLISFKLGLPSKQGRTCQLMKQDFDISMKARINNTHFPSTNR